jgi:hypothetical protein
MTESPTTPADTLRLELADAIAAGACPHQYGLIQHILNTRDDAAPTRLMLRILAGQLSLCAVPYAQRTAWARLQLAAVCAWGAFSVAEDGNTPGRRNVKGVQ